MRPGFDPNGMRLQTDASGVTVDYGFVAHFQVAAADAVAADTDGVHAAITLADGATTKVTTGITNPKVPRCLSVKGNAAGIAGNVVINGTNYNGDAITETIVAADATTVAGAKAFKTVTDITVPARNAAADTIEIGFIDALGLPYKLSHNTVLAAFADNTKEGVAPTVAVSATALESNTVKLNTALAGKVIDVYLMV